MYVIRLTTLILGFVLCLATFAAAPAFVRLPEGGMQPQAVMEAETLHVVYLSGNPSEADVFYIRSSDYGNTFSKPVRVNSQSGSAVAVGTIRGAQIAVGRGGRVHVAWNGSKTAKPKGPLNPEMSADSPYNGTPMLYSRLRRDGTFEAQRNLMTKTFALDGGGSIAADSYGNVYVGWHAKTLGAAQGEDGRQVWLSRSSDDGKTFSPETVIFSKSTGACGCCGMRLLADSRGELWALYRSAKDIVHRDVYLLHSVDRGKTFEGRRLHEWEIGSCPMSAMSFSDGSAGLIAAWETDKQVYWAEARTATGEAPVPKAPPRKADEEENRKFPVLAQNSQGEVLLVWTIAVGWGKPARLEWQRIVARGEINGAATGTIAQIPTWSFAAAFAKPSGQFVILY